jgi:branched-chain amino acid transport system ATP-binding protein
MQSDAILECRSITKRYGGVTALSDLSFEVAPGEAFGVAGPNGAGKTTLFDVVTGRATASEGVVLLRGRDITRAPVHAIARLGICRTFQTPVCFPDLTVEENVRVAACFGAGRAAKAASGLAEDALERCGLAPRRTAAARLLNVVDRKLLMIASALAAEPKLLLLDEPMGGLNHQERGAMVELLAAINRGGMAIIVIEHVMSALLALVSRVMVLREGQRIFLGTPSQMLRYEEVVRSYIGQDAATLVGAGAPAGRA